MAVSHRALLVVVAVALAAALVGVAVLWPPGPPPAEPQSPPGRLVDATLTRVTTVECDALGVLPQATCVQVRARLDGSGRTVRFDMVDDTGDTLHAGQRVRLSEVRAPDQPPTYVVSDLERDRPLVVLVALFLLVVLAFSRGQGARALVGLAITFGVLVVFLVPAISAGRNPVAVALVGALLILVTTLYLSHGFAPKTTAAVVGTALALGLTAVLAAVFLQAAAITGFADEDARLANVAVGGLSLRGLLLAGIILGGLGVLDDVTMSQSSLVFALRHADPAASYPTLVARALQVGRDHVAATVNTLFLAYAGASLPLLLLFVSGTQPLAEVLTAEVVAVEIVRTLVGSVGLIAAVPLTTALAAGLARAAPADPPGPAPAAASAAPAADEDEDDWVLRLRSAYHLPDDVRKKP